MDLSNLNPVNFRSSTCRLCGVPTYMHHAEDPDNERCERATLAWYIKHMDKIKVTDANTPRPVKEYGGRI